MSSLTINKKNYALNEIDFYGEFPIIKSTTECLTLMSKIVRYGDKTHYRTLSSSFRAPVVGRIPKGIWVT